MNKKKLQISLKNISKKYGENYILKDVCLDIYSGEFLCIFGKSGCGKSTLLNIIGTLEEYNTGTINSFSKEDPVRNDKIGMYLRRMKIAYLFQNFALVENMTVEENMVMAAKYSSQKNKRMMIEHLLDKMGVLSKLKSKVYELSGGEQQRVAIARNMVKPFEVLLADEPTGSLDGENKKIVMDILVELNKQGKTIVVVSHDMDFLKIAHRSYVIEDKKLVEIV